MVQSWTWTSVCSCQNTEVRAQWVLWFRVAFTASCGPTGWRTGRCSWRTCFIGTDSRGVASGCHSPQRHPTYCAYFLPAINVTSTYPPTCSPARRFSGILAAAWCHLDHPARRTQQQNSCIISTLSQRIINKRSTLIGHATRTEAGLSRERTFQLAQRGTRRWLEDDVHSTNQTARRVCSANRRAGDDRVGGASGVNRY